MKDNTIETKYCFDNDGKGVIQLTVPAETTMRIVEALNAILKFAGYDVRHTNGDNEAFIPAAEVFPDGSPAMALRGLRGREDMTQKELAARLGVSQNAISEMESGKRAISTKMAKKLGEAFELPYKVFL